MSLEIISFLIGLAGILFVVYPRISVAPGISLDLHNPFQTPFIIKNDGYLPIFDIKHSLVTENIELKNKTTFTNCGFISGNTVDKLSPNKSSALFVNNSFGIPSDFVNHAQVFIQVTYRPYLVPFAFTEKIRFKTEINTKNEYVWFESYDKK